jgi:hypothetical protein
MVQKAQYDKELHWDKFLKSKFLKANRCGKHLLESLALLIESLVRKRANLLAFPQTLRRRNSPISVRNPLHGTY